MLIQCRKGLQPASVVGPFAWVMQLDAFFMLPSCPCFHNTNHLIPDHDADSPAATCFCNTVGWAASQAPAVRLSRRHGNAYGFFAAYEA